MAHSLESEYESEKYFTTVENSKKYFILYNCTKCIE